MSLWRQKLFIHLLGQMALEVHAEVCRACLNGERCLRLKGQWLRCCCLLDFYSCHTITMVDGGPLLSCSVLTSHLTFRYLQGDVWPFWAL